MSTFIEERQADPATAAPLRFRFQVDCDGVDCQGGGDLFCSSEYAPSWADALAQAKTRLTGTKGFTRVCVEQDSCWPDAIFEPYTRATLLLRQLPAAEFAYALAILAKQSGATTVDQVVEFIAAYERNETWFQEQVSIPSSPRADQVRVAA